VAAEAAAASKVNLVRLQAATVEQVELLMAVTVVLEAALSLTVEALRE
jgi:hypothetical protein